MGDKPINLAFTSTAYGPLWAPACASWLRAVAVGSRHFTVTPLGELGGEKMLGKIGGAGITDRTYTHQAENGLVEDFLMDPNLTHLFMTEMDMILPHDILIKLVEMDKPIASGIYFLRNGRGQPCLFQKILTSRDNPYVFSPVSAWPNVPFRVDHAGLGCVLIKREVFEHPAMKYPWFDMNATKYGSDMYFYTKVKDAGIQVWAHPDVMADQIDYKVESKEDYLKRLKEDPNFAKGGVLIGSTEHNREGLVTVGN